MVGRKCVFFGQSTRAVLKRKDNVKRKFRVKKQISIQLANMWRPEPETKAEIFLWLFSFIPFHLTDIYDTRRFTA